MDSWVLTSQTAERVEVRIEGDIDLANSNDLAEFLDMLIASGEKTEVNLAEVEFIDSNGLAALLTRSSKSSGARRGVRPCLTERTGPALVRAHRLHAHLRHRRRRVQSVRRQLTARV